MVNQVSLSWNEMLVHLEKVYNTMKRFVDLGNLQPAYAQVVA